MRSKNTLDLLEYCLVLCDDEVSVSGQNRTRYDTICYIRVRHV